MDYYNDLDNKMNLYLCKDGPKPHWIIVFINDNNPIESRARLPIGSIVFNALNQINKMEISDVTPIDEILTFKFSDYDFDFSRWQLAYDGLVDFLEHKSELSVTEKMEKYNIYSNLMFCFLRRIPDQFSSYLYNYKSMKAKQRSNYFFKYEEEIKFKGYRFFYNPSIDSSIYSFYTVNGFEYAFVLDLYELIFNSNVSINTKRCQYCGYYFVVENNRRKLCNKCAQNYTTLKNKRQKNDLVKHTEKKIRDILSKRDDATYRIFLDENQYHKDYLAGKVKYDSQYEAVKTKEEYEAWILEYHHKIQLKKGRKKN